MLSENQIDDLIQPIITRQEQINTWVIKKIAKRVKDIGELLPSDVNQLYQLYLSGEDVRDITEHIAEETVLQITQIKNMIKLVAQDAYQDAKMLYDYRFKTYIPFKENEHLQRVITAIGNQTSGEYTNIAKAQAFMMRDISNPKKFIPTPLAKTYYNVVDTAIQATQQGVVDYNTAMRQTLKNLNDSGIRVIRYTAESGRKTTQRADTAVRRNLLDGVRAINQGVQDEIGRQVEADGKEITVHQNSAPDHEPVQGHQFSNEEFEKLQNAEPFKDVNGRQFKPIERAIGTLNCRHFTYSIIIGLNKPNFTKEQLQEFIKQNHKGFTTKDGKHFTMYECTQLQRNYEFNIRKMRTGVQMAKEAGDDKLLDFYKTKESQWLAKYKQFSDACGLSMKLNRIKVN